LASQFSSDLVEKGYAVWLDVARLGGGSDWSREIEGEIDAADVVIALLPLTCQKKPSRKDTRPRTVLENDYGCES
jgi:hypothetical protein